jgi:PKD repeat protein
MNRLLCLAGAALCCAFLSTCGTVRAINDDYAEDYIIRDISPLSGVSGAQVTFKAAVCATAGSRPLNDPTNPPQFIWNFGGGAEPNVSYDAEPQVTLRDGLRGPYEGSLSIRDGCSDDNLVTATFTLNVAALSVLDVAPLSGVENTSAIFSAVIGTGNVSEYVWDFGGACTPSGSNVANPSVRFNTPGIYSCSLIISNDFEAFEFPFTLTVLATGV